MKVYKCLIGAQKEDEPTFFSEVSSVKIRYLQIETWEIPLKYKNFFTVRMIKFWNREER